MKTLFVVVTLFGLSLSSQAGVLKFSAKKASKGAKFVAAGASKAGKAVVKVVF